MANPLEIAFNRLKLASLNVANMVTGGQVTPHANPSDTVTANDFGRLNSYLASRGYTPDQRKAITGQTPGGRNYRRVAIESGRHIRGLPDTGVDGID